MFNVSGKTELAKQVARYMHKDIKKVWKPHTHADIQYVASRRCKAQKKSSL